MQREAVDALGHQARLRRFGNTDREVISFLENIDIAIRQVEFEAQPRIAPGKGGEARKDRNAAIGRRHGHAQQSFGLRSFRLHAALGIREPCQHVAQIMCEGEARFGQGDAAGGALDEALADPRLQRGDAPADGGLSDTQFARGRAEAAAVDYREKSLGFGKAGLRKSWPYSCSYRIYDIEIMPY